MAKSKVDLALLREYAREGFSRFDIAALMGMSISTVDKICKQFHIELFRNHGIPGWKIRKIYDYYDKGFSTRQIAERLEVSEFTVRKYLRRRYSDGLEERFHPERDPRSMVCQAIQLCSHSRCHLSSRCIAFQRYIQKHGGSI